MTAPGLITRAAAARWGFAGHAADAARGTVRPGAMLTL